MRGVHQSRELSIGCRYADEPIALARVASQRSSGYPDSVTLLAAINLPPDPLEALRELTRRDLELQLLRRSQVRAARASGASWEHIGAALGIARQSAWEQYAVEVLDDVARAAADQQVLSDDEAMELAVGEVKSVRRSRHRR